MFVKQVTLSKNAKVGLPSYSNITIGCSITWELADGEEFDFPKAWDIINQEVDIQASNGTDPSWIGHTETKHTYKTVIKTPKQSTGN